MANQNAYLEYQLPNQEQGAPSAVSICEVGKHPYWMYQCDAAQRLEPFIKGRPDVTRRQDFPPAYALNGALDLARTDWLLEQQNSLDQKHSVTSCHLSARWTWTLLMIGS